MHRKVVKKISWIVLIAAIYFIVGRLSINLIFKPEGIAAIWPASGIFLSSILLTDKKLRPYLIVVLFITDFIIELQAGSAFKISLLYAFSVALNASLSAWLILLFIGETPSFAKLKHVVVFIVFSVIISNALTSSIAALGPFLSLNVSYFNSWKWWWSSDAVGNLLITPFVLSWADSLKKKRNNLNLNQIMELGALLIALTILNYYILNTLTANDDLFSFLNFLNFPFLIWAAMRFGVRGITTASILLTASLIYFIHSGRLMLFSQGLGLNTVVVIQLYLAIISLSSLFFASSVAERKKAAELLYESEECFRSVFENSPIGKAIIGIDGSIRTNNAFSDILGYSFEKLQSLNWIEFAFPNDIHSYNDAVISILKREKQVIQFDKRYLRKDESEIYLDIRTTLHKDKNGQPLFFITSINDITARKQNELLLKEKNDKIEAQNEELYQANVELLKAKEKAVASEINLQTILSSTNDIIASYDSNICLLAYNKACSETYKNIFGIDIYPGLCTLDLFPESMREFWVSNNLRAIAGETFSIEINIPSANGDLVFEQYYNPIFKDGKVICFSTFTRDITEKKRIENELIKAKEKAEESDRLKTAFLQNMSHEIRTPMNAIMGFSDLLIPNFDDKTKLNEFANIINSRCDDLLTIINDLLDISKIESGQLSVCLEVCNLNALFAELVALFEPQQKRMNKEHIQLKIVAPISPSLNLIVTDIVKLRQIFINLISNAFKFTETGTIEFGVKLDINNRKVFYVSDTGIGIPVDKFDVVFERFAQIKSGGNNFVRGTGLGLPIVKGLVELLEGNIWLESEIGKGTTFYFSFPEKT